MDNIDLCETPVSRRFGGVRNYAQWNEETRRAYDALRRVIDFGHPGRWNYSAQKRGFESASNKSFMKEESPKFSMVQRYMSGTKTPTRNFRFVCEKYGDSPSKFDSTDEDTDFTDISNVNQTVRSHEKTTPQTLKLVKVISGEIPEPKNRNIIELVDRSGIKKQLIEENGSTVLKAHLRNSRSTIRNHVPSGQTRRLTSLFESIANANKKEIKPPRRELRTKSVPPSKFHSHNISMPDEHVFSKDDSCCAASDRTVGDRTPKNVLKHLDYCSNSSGYGVQRVEIMKSEEGVKSLARKLEDAGFVCSPSPSMRDMQSPIQTQQNVQKKCVMPLYKTREFQKIDTVNSVKEHGIKPLALTLEKFQANKCLEIKDSIKNDVKSAERCKPPIACHTSSVDLSNTAGYNEDRLEWSNECVELDETCCQTSCANDTENVPEEKCIEICDTKVSSLDAHRSDSQLLHSEKTICSMTGSKVSNDSSSVDEVDQINVVDKAFKFVNEVDLQTGTEINESIGRTSYCASSSSPSENGSCNQINHNLPANFLKNNGTAVSSVAPYEVKKSLEEFQEEERYVNFGKKKACDVNKTRPLASSTPVMGSPACSERVKSCGSTLNRTFISSISNGVCTDSVQNEIDLEAELKQLHELELYWGRETVKAQTIISRKKKGTKGYNETSELFAHRNLLLARERQVMIQREIQRVKELQLSNKPRLPVYNKGDSGHINIYSITVKLNRNFCLRNLDAHESYAFLVLMKTDDVIEATDLVTLMDTRTMRVNSVHFNDQIQFGNLPSDFSLKLEVFALKVKEMPCIDDRSCTLLKNKAKLLLSPLRKANLNGSVIGTTGFTSCGYTHITKTRAGDFEVYLDATEYPLEGTINVKSSWSSTTTSASVDFSGFLAMYEVIADLGSWSRYWAVLQNGVINFWRDPNDEASSKPPIIELDLSHCKSKTVSPCSFDECYRRNTFVINLMIYSNQSYATKERIFLSADSKEMLDSWIDVLNRSLKRIDK